MTLTWDDPGDSTIEGYQVLRRSRDGLEYGDGRGATEFVAIVDDTGSSATTYADTSVAARTRYVYRVKARNPQGLSERSSYTNAETPVAPPPPTSPTGLTVSSRTHDSVTLSWNDPGDSTIEGYQVLRRSRDWSEYGDGLGDAEYVVIVDDTGSASILGAVDQDQEVPAALDDRARLQLLARGSKLAVRGFGEFDPRLFSTQLAATVTRHSSSPLRN